MKNLGDEIWNKIKEKNLQIDAESMHIGGAKNLEDKINILLKEINEIEEEKDRYYYHTGKINEEDNKEKIILTIDEVESQADLSKIYNTCACSQQESRFKSVLGHLLIDSRAINSNVNNNFINSYRLDAISGEVNPFIKTNAFDMSFGNKKIAFDNITAKKGIEYVTAELESLG
ncbi:MAG: hypothetical protein US50_C0040G0001, partial [Candidatus Nomurabacteria bacterium GW2011_GWB1_37_5]